MKKILFAVLALATMASCSNEYVVEKDREAIAFGETFVDNATKADYSQAGKLVENFKVYGTVTGNTNTALIYNGNTVTRPDAVTNGGAYMDTAWICTAATQYWVPNATYNFAAIVDGGESDVDAMPTEIPFTITDGNGDLLYATAEVEVKNDGSKEGDVSANGLVAFTFEHLLSKVYFTVTLPTMTGYSMEVTKINVEGIKANGKYDIAGKTWTAIDNATVAPLDFVTNSYQILPVEQTLNVTISYNIKYGDTVISTATKTGKLENFAPEANNVYNVTANIDVLTGISFTVNSVDGWYIPENTTPLE